MMALDDKPKTIVTPGIIRLSAAYFDLIKTFECGQAFRWRRMTGHCAEGSEVVYEGVASGRFLRIRQRTGEVLLETTSEAFEGFWKRYFDLETDYAALEDALLERDTSTAMAQAAEFGRGIRILRQDPWEMLMTFILSGNNNIPRIKGSIEALSERFGEIVHGGVGASAALKAFPSPEALSGVGLDDFRQAGAGYRDRYLKSAAERVASRAADLEAWRLLDDAALKAALMTLPGVGDKVAECVMLFAYGRMASFPVDTWITKTVRRLYLSHEAKPKEIKAFAQARFGAQAGYAQQVLFYAGRNFELEA